MRGPKRTLHYVVTVGYFVKVEPGQDARDASAYVLTELLRESPQFYKARPATKRELAMTVQP